MDQQNKTPDAVTSTAASEAARSARRFGLITVCLLILAMGAIAALSKLEVFGAGFHVNFALVLGVLGSILLGVGLMALSFYSDRSGADDGVLGTGNDDLNAGGK